MSDLNKHSHETVGDTIAEQRAVAEKSLATRSRTNDADLTPITNSETQQNFSAYGTGLPLNTPSGAPEAVLLSPSSLRGVALNPGAAGYNAEDIFNGNFPGRK